MTHSGLVCIWAVSCSVGVNETVKGFTVAGFDGLLPCLLDRKAKTCMVGSDKSTNAREFKAAGIERGLGGFGSKSQGLGNSILVADEAGMASIINGAKPLAGMELVGGRCGRRPVRGGIEGLWWGLDWGNGGREKKIGSVSAWAQFLMLVKKRCCRYIRWIPLE
jgi:hypothetical protein